VALIAGEESIREVIAFPKNNRGAELLTGSPAPAEMKQLRELYISSTVKPKQAGVPGAPGALVA
jgi:aspartyl-tRNA synthetase